MSFGLPGWPGGDPDAIKDAATAWTTMSSEITAAVDTADGIVQESFARLEGDTKRAYLAIWNNFAAKERTTAEGAAKIAEKLREIASAIEEAHTKYKHILAGLTVAAAAGVVVGIFTLGIGDAVVSSAAIGAAATAITSLLEGLGATIEAAIVTNLLSDMVVGALVGTEFSVFLQEGESIGAGEGPTMIDFSDTAVAALTGGLLSGAAGAGDVIADLRSLSGTGAALLKALAGAGVTGGGSMLGSALDGEGVGSLSQVLLAAALGGAGVSVEGASSAVARDVERLTALGEDESHTALNLAALYREDPDLLAAISKDPYQSDDIRYLAGQYRDLFDADPTILHDVPDVATLLKQNPTEVNRILQANQAISQIGHDVHLPPSVRTTLLEHVARNERSIGVAFDGASDEVKDWVKMHHEELAELEERLEEISG